METSEIIRIIQEQGFERKQLEEIMDEIKEMYHKKLIEKLEADYKYYKKEGYI